MPVDHEIFESINATQWMWYFYNFIEDQNEDFTTKRDLVEYHASFIEPEAVRKIRESREQSVNVPHDEFVAGLEYFFGRKANITQEKKKGTMSHSVDPSVAARVSDSYKNQQSAPPSKQLDYRHWLDVDLG